MSENIRPLTVDQYRAIQPEMEAFRATMQAHAEAQDRLARMVRLIEPDPAWKFNADHCVFTREADDAEA